MTDQEEPTFTSVDQGELQPFLVDAKSAANLLSISRAMLHRLNVTGRLPRPVHLGRRVLWRVSELEGWVNAGCPNRDRWEADDDGVWRAKPGLEGNRPFAPKSRARR